MSGARRTVPAEADTPESLRAELAALLPRLAAPALRELPALARGLAG